MVASFTELLAERYEGKLDATADRYIRYAVEGAHRMKGLISDLLAISRVGTRGEPLAPVDCREAVTDALRILDATVTSNAAEIVVGDLPSVLADRGQLVQVFRDLIANAIKFRDEEPPRIEITSRRAAERWEISVADTGIGIDPQFHERIFVIFQRLHERGRYPGSGSGIAMVKKIVERHGGRVRVDSGPGNGARFYFTLSAVGGRRRESDG